MKRKSISVLALLILLFTLTVQGVLAYPPTTGCGIKKVSSTKIDWWGYTSENAPDAYLLHTRVTLLRYQNGGWTNYAVIAAQKAGPGTARAERKGYTVPAGTYATSCNHDANYTTGHEWHRQAGSPGSVKLP